MQNIEINNKHYFVTNSPRLWSLSSAYIKLDNFIFFIYEIIRAIKLAIEALNLRKEDIEKIFYLNAKRLINDIINKE